MAIVLCVFNEVCRPSCLPFEAVDVRNGIIAMHGMLATAHSVAFRLPVGVDFRGKLEGIMEQRSIYLWQ
jgi:hypothetical protein